MRESEREGAREGWREGAGLDVRVLSRVCNGFGECDDRSICMYAPVLQRESSVLTTYWSESTQSSR